MSWETGEGSGLPWLSQAIGYRSARSAMVAALRAAKPSKVWCPAYICGLVPAVLEAAGILVQPYALEEGCRVPAGLRLQPDEWLIVVDYFGISGEAVKDALNRHDRDRVLVDASHSLFLPPPRCGAIVYSPRKFVGLPDGGLLLTDLHLPSPLTADEAESIARCSHLLSRLSGRVGEAYLEFQRNEASLADADPVGMSRLTRNLLQATDFERIARMRRENYAVLSEYLNGWGLIVPALQAESVPLCCPLMGVDAARIRPLLAARNVFTPSYWQDSRIEADDQIAFLLREGTLFLPCDQRYRAPELKQMAASVLKLLGRT